MIICAAIKLNMANDVKTELIICGHRHSDCFITITQLNDPWRKATKTDGFIDHNNNFLDRKEAYKHALECGQINQHAKWYREDHNDNTEELYSEDLY